MDKELIILMDLDMNIGAKVKLLILMVNQK